MNKHFKIILLCLSIFIIACNYNSEKKYLREIEYKGIIDSIFEDTWNHSMFTFIVEDNKKKSEVLAENWTKSWEYAEIGDSIIKPADTLMIIIKKNDSIFKQFYYGF